MGVSSPEIGAVLLGGYVLEAKLGATTGHVYRARRQRDGKVVVARLFQPALPLMAADFLELAQTATRIRHPALASVEAYGRHGDKSCFIISEFVTGLKLDEWADEVGIPPLVQVIELVRHVCLGLQAAARSGLAHDSLNPRNVVVLKPSQGPGPRMPVKLLDLGVPAFLAPREPRAQAVRFMAPEQLAALATEDRSVAFRCTGTMNVYSCGCLLYYLCTGGPPYPGATVAELRAAQSAGRMAPPLRINPQISPAFNTLILRALALEPRERFATVGDLAEALASVIGSLQAHGKGSLAPVDVQAAVPLMSMPEPEEDEPPTFKTVRPPDAYVEAQVRSMDSSMDRSRAQTFEVSAMDGDDAQTMPPGPAHGSDAPDAGPPIGLFSSAPPWRGRRSPTPPPPRTARPERGTPLALFSEPAPSMRAPANIIVAKGEPMTSLLVGPYDGGAVHRSRQWRKPGVGRWVWPLSAAACAAAYFVGRLFVADPTPIASVEPAANSTPATPSESNKTGAQVPQPTASADRGVPPNLAPEADHPSAAAEQTAAQVAVLDRSRDRDRDRDRGRGRPVARSSGREGRSDLSNAEVAKDEVIEVRSAEPALVVPVERDAGMPHGRQATPLSEKIVAPEPGPAKLAASSAPTTTARPPVRAEPALPLQATVQIQGVAVRGSLPTSLVRRAVERIRPQLAACYSRAAHAAGHNGFGELSVDVQIDERGRARNPHANGAALPQLNACVADAASKLVSEKAPDTGTVNASWKVAFTP
jgi:serine/threonine-protein kinase